jgi:RNA polymerase sigma factor (sigma-70 family)
MYADAQRITKRDESFCLDVVHDAMLRVIKSLPRMESEASLGRWLHVTVRSCAIDRIRRDARRRRREHVAPPPAPVSAGGEDLTERVAWLRRELAALSPRRQTTLMMRHKWGWTLAQIAAALRETTGSVDGRLRRTLEVLRRRAREAFDDD